MKKYKCQKSYDVVRPARRAGVVPHTDVLFSEICVAIHKCDREGNVYTLLKPVSCFGLFVPAGFKSDGASVPRFFWRWVFPPGDSRALLAAFVHDYIYRNHPAGWTKATADRVFLALLILRGVPVKNALRAYWGVYWLGKKAWEAGNGTETDD